MVLALALFTGCTTGEVRLVLFALGMGQVGAVILVDGETETTLEAADMVLEEVRVLVEIDGLERKLAQPLATVSVGCGVRRNASATEFGACSILCDLLDRVLKEPDFQRERITVAQGLRTW